MVFWHASRSEQMEHRLVVTCIYMKQRIWIRTDVIEAYVELYKDIGWCMALHLRLWRIEVLAPCCGGLNRCPHDFHNEACSFVGLSRNIQCDVNKKVL